MHGTRPQDRACLCHYGTPSPWYEAAHARLAAVDGPSASALRSLTAAARSATTSAAKRPASHPAHQPRGRAGIGERRCFGGLRQNRRATGADRGRISGSSAGAGTPSDPGDRRGASGRRAQADRPALHDSAPRPPRAQSPRRKPLPQGSQPRAHAAQSASPLRRRTG